MSTIGNKHGTTTSQRPRTLRLAVLQLLDLDILLLVLVPLLLVGVGADALREFPAIPADLVPGEAEQRIHALERLAARLGDEEPDPGETQGADDRAEIEEAVGVHVQQHGGDGLGVAVLVHKVETHDQRRPERAESDRVDFGVDQVLERVPAHRLADCERLIV